MDASAKQSLAYAWLVVLRHFMVSSIAAGHVRFNAVAPAWHGPQAPLLAVRVKNSYQRQRPTSTPPLRSVRHMALHCQTAPPV